jgi:hypothetical protein
VCLILFLILPLESAAIASLLGGYMLLPSGMQVDVPLLPPLDKMSITAIATLLLCWMKGPAMRHPRQSYFIYLFGAAFIAAPILTSLENSYELLNPKGSIPGFYPLDGLKYAGRNLLMLAPFHIGSRFLSSDNARSLFLKYLPAAALIYSLPMLFELRMAPQLHTWVYGYFPGDAFSQQIRGTGYRPVVFFEHGLALALFTALAFVASLIVLRMRGRIFHLPAGVASAYLAGLLVIACKSLGPIIYAGIVAPLVLFTRPRLWVKASCAVCLVVCAYPALRNNGLAPTQLVSDFASHVSVERNKSFETRVVNEGQLLAKANEKPFFGWGSWGRNRVYDKDTGKDISITDGGWVIQFGTFGWFGYLSLFGLLAAAAFQPLRRIGTNATPADVSLAGLTLMLGIYVVDQVPNANPFALMLLIAGSVATAGRVREGRPSTRTIKRDRRPAPSAIAAALPNAG